MDVNGSEVNKSTEGVRWNEVLRARGAARSALWR
jgi:hypothetical protein